MSVEHSDSADPPAWFTAALAAPVTVGTTPVDGTDVAYRSWGEPSASGIVLVHGGGAHSRWWDHLAPLLAANRRVTALDLSGHGDSGRRPQYSINFWAKELLAVASASGMTEPPIVIGHSMGGFVALHAASLFGAQLAGAVAIDSPVRDITPEERAAREHRAFGPLKVYPTRELALARFRPVPDQPTLPYIRRYIGETSIRPIEGGWTWKFDPHLFLRPHESPALSQVDCRVALFRAEHGMLSEAISQVMYDRLGRLAPVIEIPDAGHHVMMDQPLALITGLRTLLADWEHSLSKAAD